MKIEDFGKKIGGAKKDIWKSRGLELDDILQMNQQEKIKFIKKDSIWKKPDYQKMVDDGLPVRVAYFIKSVRDALPTKPNTPAYIYEHDITFQREQEKFISFITEMRDALLNLKTEEDVLSFYEHFIKDNYVVSSGYRVTATDKVAGLYSNKVHQKANVSNWFMLDREIRKKQFCYSDEEKLLADYTIVQFNTEHTAFEKDYQHRTILVVTVPNGRRFYYPKGDFSIEENWKDNTYFLLKNHEVISINFDTVDKAKAFALEREQVKPMRQSASSDRKKRKKAFVPPQLQHIERTGENYRKGKNIKGEEYLDIFGFRGGEFGNWMNETDRQQSLNYGYDALLDMCKALEIQPRDISLHNTLAIAFGARGEGNALAHYEPMRTVINLTKMKGAGSLAHEWGHALDDFIGKSLGFKGESTLASGRISREESLASMKKLIDAMKYKVDDSPVLIVKQEQEYENAKNFLSRNINDGMQDMPERYLERKEQLKERFLNCKDVAERESILIEMSVLKKEATNRKLPESERNNLRGWHNRLLALENRIGTVEKIRTDFYKNSIKFDEGASKTSHGYWQSNEEMFARAFACYVYDKVAGRSDYLCGHANCAVMNYTDRNGASEVIKAFPVGEERESINQCFDELMKELKEKELLRDYKFPDMQEVKNENTKESMRAESETIPITSNDNGQFSFDLDMEEEYER